MIPAAVLVGLLAAGPAMAQDDTEDPAQEGEQLSLIHI